MQKSARLAIPFLALVIAVAGIVAIILPASHAVHEDEVNSEYHVVQYQSTDDLTPYVKNDIFHAFGNMDLFVMLDDEYHLIVNEIVANNHPKITELDLLIIRDYVVHSDAIIDAMKNGPVGRVNELEFNNLELLDALDDFETGKFSNLFNHGGSEIRTTSLETHVPIVYPAYTNAQNINAFETSSVVPTYHGDPNSATVCGGGYDDYHTKPPINKIFNDDDGMRFDTKAEVKEFLVDDGYHSVRLYATGSMIFGGHYGDDYAKISSYSGCSRGEFRDQALVAGIGTNAHYRSQGPEPNPEILHYIWPSYWWGPYVVEWHKNN